jgi:serine/threonine protein kinase
VSNADKDKESDIFKLTNNSLNDHINKELKFEEKYKIINEENYDFYFPSYKIKLNKSESDKEELFSMIKIEKKIFGSLLNDKKILKEVTLLSEFDSKYLLKTYECFISNKFYYLITEHCSYSRLNEKLRCEIKYTENQICYIIIQILKAIKYLNSKNYVHVEISPEKILICDLIKSSYGEELYNIKLLNFFCPSRSNLLFNSKSFYQYIAPEIMNKKYSKNCYIWSLGIIIFQMYFGELSYKYNNDINEYVQIMRTTYKYNEEMSPELKDLLDKMIEINPEYRTNIDECLEHNWINKKDTEIVVGEIDSLK